MVRRLALMMSLAMVVVLLAACGDDGDDPTATSAPAATATTGAAPTTGTGGDGEGDAEAGRQVAGTLCAACHSVDGSASVGPTWQGLFGSEIELEGGDTVTADEEYIHESIVDPSAKVHAGFSDGIMPSFETSLTDEQINDIIAYIKTLE